VNAARVKALALEAGFDLVGIAGVEPPREAAFFADWIAAGYAGGMEYLTRRKEQRVQPWARSIVCVGLQYDTPHPYSASVAPDRGWISRYAWGDDYHEVVMERLAVFERCLKAEIGDFECRAYADTGPLIERVFAASAGLGAWGKNTCLIHPEHGSWFFLGELVTDLPLQSDAPRASLCGRCRACLDACPTGALRAPYVLDATLCISYLTIELKGSIPEEMRPAIGRHVFGCDICQDVCPWNRKRRHRGGAAFEQRGGLFAPRLQELACSNDEDFRRMFERSALKRARRGRLLRNVAVALGNVGDTTAGDALERLARDADALVREHAVWAMGRLPRGGSINRADR
jgi:epoxyqueuosine reductase